MKRDTVNYLMVGSFVVLMGVAFLVLLFAVTGRSGPADHYFAIYDNVAGVKFGTGVFYEGYLVGQVEQVEPEATAEGMRYRVEMSVMAAWQIPSDSVAAIESSGLISAVTIQISEGTSTKFLRPGDTINARAQRDLFAALNQAANEFGSLSQDGLLPVLRNVNDRVTQLFDEIVRFRRDELSPFIGMMHQRVDEDLVEEVVQLLNHLDESAQGLKSFMSDGNREKVGSFLTHIDQVAVNLNALVERIEITRLEMSSAIGKLDGVVEANQDNVGQTIASAQRAMAELDVSLRTTNQHLGAIMHNVESSSRHLNEFSRAIRENPARLIRSPAVGEAQ